MSKKMKERNLEPVVTLGCEAGLLLAAPARTAKSTDTHKTKTTLRNRGMRAKGGDAARVASSTKTRKSTTRNRSIGKDRLVKKRAVGKKSTLAEKVIKVDEIIPGINAQAEEQNLLQEMGAPAGLETSRELVPAINRETLCENEALISDNTFEETVVDAPGKEPELTADLVEIPQPTGLRRKMILHCLAGAWNWTRKQLKSRQVRKRLRVCESVSLGEKRFVAVIEVDGEQFLVGGASSSVATLARLEPSQQFSEVLKQRWAQDPVQA